MNAPIRSLPGEYPKLSTRAKNCLENAWSRAGWLLPMTPSNVAKLLTVGDLKAEPNFGDKSLAEVREWLDFYGFTLSVVPFGKRLKVELEERAELARLKAKYE